MANDIKIKGSHPISENLSTITVGDQTTCLEISDKNGARITGDLEVTGDIKGNVTDITFDDITFDDITTGDIVCDSIAIDNITIDGTEIDSSSGITIDAAIHISLDHGPDDEVKLLEDGSDFGTIYGNDSGSYLKLYEGVGETTDSFSIYTTTHGATTIGTVDVAGQSANMTFDADGIFQLKAYGSGSAIAESLSKDILISPGGKVHIDKDRSHTTAASMTALEIDFDRTGTVSTGTDATTGLKVDIDHTGASGGTITSYGINAIITGDSGGTSTANGLTMTVEGADTCNGIYLDNENGGTDFKNVSSADATDYFTLNTIAAGATTLTTVDTTVGESAHLTLVPDGDTIIDRNVGITDAGTYKGLFIDLDKTGASTTNNSIYGLHIDVDNTTATDGINTMYGILCTPTLTSAADAGSSILYGEYILATGNNAGGSHASLNIGISLQTTGADENNGLTMVNDNSGKDYDLRIQSSADTGDYFKILTTTNGATTISTVDDDGNDDADLTIDIDGSISLDSATGEFVARKAGTEFSATNSSYAGMILGYTRLQGDLTTQDTYEIQDDMTVEDDRHQITFKTPPSELVEIEATFAVNRLSTDSKICAGLSDQSASEGYNSLGIEYEYDALGVDFSDDESDDVIVVVKWVVIASDLEAIGSSNTLYIGFSTGGSSKSAYLAYGYRSTHGIMDQPFIIKATALPASIYDGE